MNYSTVPTPKRIAITSFDENKKDFVEWSYKHKDYLKEQDLFAMGKSSAHLSAVLQRDIKTIPSVLNWGDRMLMDMIRNGEIDVLILFFDTTSANRREKYILDILQLAINKNIVVGSNRATADLIMTQLTNEAAKENTAEKHSASLAA